MGPRIAVAAAASALLGLASCAPLPPRVARQPEQVPVQEPPAARDGITQSAPNPSSPLPEIPSESPAPGGTWATADAVPTADLDRLRANGLLIPVKGAKRERIEDSFDAPRDGGRRHDAVDILAPRGTPIISATDGVIARVGTNTLGGNTVWVTDADQRFTYYYAHLDRYARIKQGETVTRGTVLGYVGTTGNAPPDVPHLHFQVMRITDPKRWWDGTPVNPFPYLQEPGAIVQVGARAPSDR
jgi:murein DD-endopeptidase MepM/ murein hydrolase activator NlpD